MTPFFLIFSFLILSLPSFGQSSERPVTIVVPVSVIGEVSDSRKQILQNTLDDKLKEHFRLIPQDQFEREKIRSSRNWTMKNVLRINVL